MRNLKQAQDGAQVEEDYERTLAAERERKARHTAGRWSMQKGGVFYVSEAIKMLTVRAEDEVERARGIVAKIEAKKEVKVFIDAIIAKRRYFKRAR